MLLYAYVSGNPLVLIDPLGLMPFIGGWVGDFCSKQLGFANQVEAMTLIGEAIADTAVDIAVGFAEDAATPQGIKNAQFAMQVATIENNATNGNPTVGGALMTGLAVKTGMQSVAEGIAGFDVASQTRLSATESASRILLGSSQGLSIAAAGGAAAAPVTGVVNATTSRTNSQLVQSIATRAEAKVGGTGRLAGIEKHDYAKRLLDRYQRVHGDRGLRTEVSVIDRERVKYGTAGSVRLDVIKEPIANPSAIYDYKFGSSSLTPGRIRQIEAIGGYRGVPILPIHP